MGNDGKMLVEGGVWRGVGGVRGEILQKKTRFEDGGKG